MEDIMYPPFQETPIHSKRQKAQELSYEELLTALDEFRGKSTMRTHTQNTYIILLYTNTCISRYISPYQHNCIVRHTLYCYGMYVIYIYIYMMELA